MAFKSAYSKGRYAGTDICNGKSVEEVVLHHMRNNPYKGKTQREDYIKGVSDFCNDVEARRNRKMNEQSQG